MNRSMLENSSKRLQRIVTILLIVAIVGQVLAFGRFLLKITDSGKFVFDMSLLSFNNVIYFLIQMAVAFVFAICVFKYYNHEKTKKYIVIVFALLSILSLWSAIEEFMYDSYFGILYLAEFALFLLGSISSAKGVKNKIFIREALAIGIFMGFLALFFVYQNMDFHKTYAVENLFFLPCNAIAHILLYSSLHTYISDTEVFPDYKKFAKKMKSNSEEIEPKQALKVLKTKFERGIISEQEYKKEKTAILKKI